MLRLKSWECLFSVARLGEALYQAIEANGEPSADRKLSSIGWYMLPLLNNLWGPISSDIIDALRRVFACITMIVRYTRSKDVDT